MSASPKPSRIARLSAARLAAVQAVYQIGASGQSTDQAGRDFLRHYAGMMIEDVPMVPPDPDLFSAILRGIEDNRHALQTVLAQCLRKDSKESGASREAETGAIPSSDPKSIEPLLMAILLCGACEILTAPQTDTAIIISDYLHVTRAFYGQNEPALVHGVLDSVAGILRTA